MTRARDLANIADGTFTATDLDLSGTLTVSGDATFDTNTLFVDVSANAVGIGTTSPSTKLHLGGSAPLDSIIRQDSTVSGTNWEIGERSAGKWQIWEDDADSVVATFQSNGNVGIGTTSPAQKLDVTDGAITAGGTGTVLIGRFSSSFPNPGDGYFSLTTNNQDGENGGISFNTLSSGTLAERMRITGAGRVGIGVSSPLVPLHVQTSSGSPWFLSKNSTDELYVGVNTSFNLPSIESNTAIRFSTGASFAEAMRLDASGNLLVGTTSKFLIGRVCSLAADGIASFETKPSSNISYNAAVFLNSSNTQVGRILCTGSATSYETSSDARLKENIADAESASELIDAIQVRSFDWKTDGSHQRYGMVAQELLEVAPEAVSQGATEDDMMGVDYSKLVPMLVKEIQSLRARVAQLEGA